MASGTGKPAALDVITVGRCSVDLYGQQIGSRLEDVTSCVRRAGTPKRGPNPTCCNGWSS